MITSINMQGNREYIMSGAPAIFSAPAPIRLSFAAPVAALV